MCMEGIECMCMEGIATSPRSCPYDTQVTNIDSTYRRKLGKLGLLLHRGLAGLGLG